MPDRFLSSYPEAVAAYLVKELAATADEYLVDLEDIKTGFDGKIRVLAHSKNMRLVRYLKESGVRLLRAKVWHFRRSGSSSRFTLINLHNPPEMLFYDIVWGLNQSRPRLK